MKLHGHLFKLFEENKISTFDFNFLKNWLNKKNGGKYSKADEQARNLAILFRNKLGETIHSSIAPILGLQSFRQVQRIKSR